MLLSVLSIVFTQLSMIAFFSTLIFYPTIFDLALYISLPASFLSFLLQTVVAATIISCYLTGRKRSVPTLLACWLIAVGLVAASCNLNRAFLLFGLLIVIPSTALSLAAIVQLHSNQKDT